jgi:hypothetical protein
MTENGGRSKNVDGRDIGAKQSFVASPGHDDGGFSSQLSKSHNSTFPRRDAPELCMNAPPQTGRGECRALDAPAVSRAK